MINNTMKESKSQTEGNRGKTSTTKPNEVGGFYFSSGIKITDPQTQEVLVHKRGDS